MNDRSIIHLGALLIALDTTMVNLISSMKRHTTPSTPCDAARFTRNRVQACRERLDSPQTEAARQRWSCLPCQLGVELQLDKTPVNA
ncbi:hypothetical protein [Pseudomonas sp. TMP25]|uniref:hypothetical protein n=1 Tax=Pseudomonas sp. TMP25 TaxID=3136561 RepID=UPI003100BF57